jgi:hypothetical protein
MSGPVSLSAEIDGIPFLPGVFVLDAANSGRLPNVCHAGSFRRTRTGIITRKRKAGKIRGRKKRRILHDIPVKDAPLFGVFLDNRITAMAV